VSTVDRAREAVLSHGLSDPGGSEPAVLGIDDGRAFASTMIDDRTVGLALTAHDHGAVELPDESVDRLARAQQESAGVALVLEAQLLEVAARLDAAGIPLRVVKGPALAHTAYPDPAWREFGDIDLLVPGRVLPDAAAALEGVGFRRAFRSVGRRYEQEVGKSVTLRSAAGWELDLHRSLASGPWGVLADPAALWTDRAALELGGRTLPTLTAEVHLAHALLHVGLGSPRPRGSNLRDLLQLDAVVSDRGAVLGLLDRWSALYPAQVARGFLPPGLQPALDWLGRRAPSRRERRWMALYRRSPQPFRRLTLEGLLAVGPSRAAVGYLRAVAPLARPGGPTP
jgi:hypothetical protein